MASLNQKSCKTEGKGSKEESPQRVIQKLRWAGNPLTSICNQMLTTGRKPAPKLQPYQLQGLANFSTGITDKSSQQAVHKTVAHRQKELPPAGQQHFKLQVYFGNLEEFLCKKAGAGAVTITIEASHEQEASSAPSSAGCPHLSLCSWAQATPTSSSPEPPPPFDDGFAGPLLWFFLASSRRDPQIKRFRRGLRFSSPFLLASRHSFSPLVESTNQAFQGQTIASVFLAMTMKTEGKRKRTIEVVEETGGEGERQRSEPAAVEVNVDVVGEETGGQRLVPAGDNEASGRGGAEGKRKRTGPTAIEVVEETGGEGERQRSEPAAVEVVEEENVDAVGEETGGQRLVPAGDNEASGRGGIHDDLVHEVISWMPARDAARFTALSSKWGKILHNPNFWISDHRAAPNEVRITYCLNDSQPQDREFAFHDFPDSVLGRSFPLGFGYRYFGTVNGLLALQVSHMVNPKFSCCIVFNPASNLDASFIFLGVNSSYRCCGFGYSDISQKYKVLIHGAGRLLVETLGDDQGGEPRILCSDSTIRYDPSICLGDTIYVLENTEGSERVPRLMAFAVLSEIVSTVELPVAGQALHSGLMVMTGSLCVATRGSTDEVLLWRHKAQEGWEKVAVLKAVSPGRVLGAWTHVSLKKVLRTWTYEVKLLLWFEDYGAVLYQKDGGGDGEFQLVWSLTFQDHFDSSREDLRHETANINLAVCWAFRPTLISPMALIGSSQANHRILMALVKRHHIPTAPPLSFVKCIAEVLGGNQ